MPAYGKITVDLSKSIRWTNWMRCLVKKHGGQYPRPYNGNKFILSEIRIEANLVTVLLALTRMSKDGNNQSAVYPSFTIFVRSRVEMLWVELTRASNTANSHLGSCWCHHLLSAKVNRFVVRGMSNARSIVPVPQSVNSSGKAKLCNETSPSNSAAHHLLHSENTVRPIPVGDHIRIHSFPKFGKAVADNRLKVYLYDERLSFNYQRCFEVKGGITISFVPYPTSPDCLRVCQCRSYSK